MYDMRYTFHGILSGLAKNFHFLVGLAKKPRFNALRAFKPRDSVVETNQPEKNPGPIIFIQILIRQDYGIFRTLPIQLSRDNPVGEALSNQVRVYIAVTLFRPMILFKRKPVWKDSF